VAIEFSLREFLMPLAILRMRRALMRTQRLDEQGLHGYQNTQLQRIVAHAVRKVPFYREMFSKLGLRADDIASVDDLKRLPLLARETVRRDPDAFHADNWMRYRPRAAHTSGTSGFPLEFYTDRDSNALEFVHYWRHWSWAGFHLGDRFAELASIHFLRRPRLDGKSFDLQATYGRLLLNSMRLTRANAGDYASVLRRFKPLYLKGLPSALYHLATLLPATGIALRPVRAIFSGGEVVTREIRQTIESAFQCPLLDSYGQMERAACIAQCPHGSYHVLSDYGILELVDPRPADEDGIVLAGAVGTTLYNRAMPLLRYEIGDLIEVFQNPPRCRCGRSFPVVRGVRGRVAAAIVTPEGRRESALFALPAILPGIAFLQFIQETPERVEVRVVRSDNFDADCDLALRRCLREALGPSIEVEFRYVAFEETERDGSGKHPIVISSICTASDDEERARAAASRSA
jgi:phenylacetate-CoA ligase